MIFSCFSAACSFLMSQTPELTHVSVGDTVQLKCTFENKVSYCYSAVVWQKLNLRTGKLTPVMSGSHQHDEKTCVLTLTNVMTKDSGLYYCISHHNSMAIVGSGSRVIVTGKSGVKSHQLFYGSRSLYQMTFCCDMCCRSLCCGTRTVHLILSIRHWLIIGSTAVSGDRG